MNEEEFDEDDLALGIEMDLSAINNLNSGPAQSPTYPTVPGLSKDDCLKLGRCFERPVCTETIFILECFLSQATLSECNSAVQLYGLALKKLEESKETRSQELLASLGIYFALFLRRKPDLNIYIEGEHLLMRGLKAYYPYMAMYLVHFLVPAVMTGVDLQLPYLQSSSSPQPAIQNSEPGVYDVSQGQGFEYRRMRQRQYEDHLRYQVGAPIRISSDHVDSMGNSYHPSSGTLKVPVINKLIDICSLNSPERKLLGEIRRVQNVSPAELLARLGLKEERQQLAIFLDDLSLLDGALEEDDIQTAIFVHSNRIMAAHVECLLPHHFDRAVVCLNYTVAKLTNVFSDWVSDRALDDFFFFCKELRHAYCLEILKLVVQKNITLCRHRIGKLPEAWRAEIAQIYTTPRWKSIPEASKNGNEQDDLPWITDSNEERNASLDYYRLYLGSLKPKKEFLASVKKLVETLGTEEARAQFVEKIRISNKSYYLLQVSGYMDFQLGTQIQFANTQDIMLNDIFELPRNFIFPCLEGDKIFLFDHNNSQSLIKTRQNIYTRQALPPEVLEHITTNYQNYNNLGLSTRVFPMSEFLEELVNGRNIEEQCSCSTKKNYTHRLVRLLRQYSVTLESLNFVNLKDILIKLAMISFNLQADSLDSLWTKLYRSIKTSPEEHRESLKRTVASLILIYSRAGTNYIIHI